MKKAALHNLGCKVNAYEMESMRQQLERAGYEIVPFEPGADVYVINTCTVTNIADRKSRQMLHRAKKMNPSAVVVAVGCYAQVRGRELEADPAIDLVIGTNRKNDLVAEIERYWKTGKKDTDVVDLTRPSSYETMEIDREERRTRAFLKVQDGCNQFCSYCIIPFARGRVRSRSIEDAVRETERLAEAGFQEIVLTGIHLCSYGMDQGDDVTLLRLIRAICAVDGIRRVRLGSLEPGSIDENFVAGIAALPEVCPHFHLSLQSGCGSTLKRMNRRYTPEEFLQTVQLLRRYYDDPALTTDIICGFPGETEEEFEESRSFVEQIHFFETHIFPYSKREGTMAARDPHQLTEAQKKKRCAVLHELDARRRREYLSRAVGTECEVLFEGRETLGGRSGWSGLTRKYRRVFLESEENLSGEMRVVVPRAVADGGYLVI